MNRDARLRRMRVRSWRRGTREMDLLLGGFADCWLESLATPELDAFEAFLAQEDPAVAGILFGDAAARADWPIAERIRQHHGIGIQEKG